MWITQREDYYNNKGYTDTQHATEHAQNINIFITTHPPPLQKKLSTHLLLLLVLLLESMR